MTDVGKFRMMGKAGVVIRVVDGKAESRVAIERANISDLSQLYTFLEIAKIRVMEQIEKITKKN